MKNKKETRKKLIRKLQRKMFVNKEYYDKKAEELKEGIKENIKKLTDEIKELKNCLEILKEEKWIK